MFFQLSFRLAYVPLQLLQPGDLFFTHAWTPREPAAVIGRTNFAAGDTPHPQTVIVILYKLIFRSVPVYVGDDVIHPNYIVRAFGDPADIAADPAPRSILIIIAVFLAKSLQMHG